MVNETSRLINETTPTKDETPLPKVQMGILLLCLLADALSITVVYPLSPYLVQDFFHFNEHEQSSIAYYSGIIAAAYTIGQIIGSPFWGSLSDRVGRRPVILVGMAGNVICLCCFGCATTYKTALGLRLAQGLASGNIPVIKTYISDITDDTNESRAFAFVAVVFGLGITIGPALGGLLVHPARQYPGLFTGTIFAKYPYLLPVSWIALTISISLVLAIFLLPESHHKHISKNELAKKMTVGTPRAILRDLESSVGTPITTELAQMDPESCTAGWKIVLRCQNFRKSCILQVMLGLCTSGFWEVLPVYGRSLPKYGGIGFGPANIGALQSIAGIFILCCSLFLYSRVCKVYGCVRVYQMGILALKFAVPIPIVLTTLNLTREDSMTWILLLFSMLMYSLAGNMCFTSFTIMITASVPKKYCGLGLGISQSVVNVGYAMGPILGGVLFSYFASIPSIPYPFDNGLLYFVLVEILLFVTFNTTSVLPAWPWGIPEELSP